MKFQLTSDNPTGRTVLQNAVLNGDMAELRRVLDDGDNPNDMDRAGWSALHFAAREYRPDMVALLIERGAIVDARDCHGNSPLFRAVFDSLGRGEVISLLRAAGADPSLQNLHGVSPLKLAQTIANYNVRQFFADLASTGTV